MVEEILTPVMMIRWMLLSSLNFLNKSELSLFTGRGCPDEVSAGRTIRLHTSLSFIHNQDLPAGCVLENRGGLLGSGDSLVGRDENVELGPSRSFGRLIMVQLILLHYGTPLGSAVVRNHAQRGGPLRKFTDPVGDGGIGHNYQRWPGLPAPHDMPEERRNLHGLALVLRVSAT